MLRSGHSGEIITKTMSSNTSEVLSVGLPDSDRVIEEVSEETLNGNTLTNVVSTTPVTVANDQAALDIEITLENQDKPGIMDENSQGKFKEELADKLKAIIGNVARELAKKPLVGPKKFFPTRKKKS